MHAHAHHQCHFIVMASRGPSTNSTRTSCRRPLLRTRPLPPSPPPSPHRGTIVSTTNHFPSATVSVTELQEVLGDYQHIKQQLARLRKQVFMTELKGLAEISALVSENGEEGFKSKRRPQHGVNLVAKTQMKVGKEAEEAMVWMLKAEVEEMNQSLKQREEEHEEEKTHLQAYCIELEDHVATAMEQAELAQVVFLIALSFLLWLNTRSHFLSPTLLSSLPLVVGTSTGSARRAGTRSRKLPSRNFPPSRTDRGTSRSP